MTVYSGSEKLFSMSSNMLKSMSFPGASPPWTPYQVLALNTLIKKVIAANLKNSQ